MEMKRNPIITVVVPIYNVEKYLKECVDSILCQTYSNLEIILVDDGSPDKCGNICDEYKVMDSRVKVIHQKNKGLSGARNAAIDIASGEYITFVDSDDYIDPDMIEILYHQISLNNAEISVGAFESFCDNKILGGNAHDNQIFVYNRENALDCFLFNDYLTPCVCGKLYKIDLWESVRCPEGKLFEDQFTTYKLIDLCKRIVFVSKPLYHYRKRLGSIGHSKFSEQTYDLYNAIHEEYNYINKIYGDFCPNIAVARITWEIVFINMMISDCKNDKNVIKDVQSFARKNIISVWKCCYISKLRKGQISLFVISFPLYVGFYKWYKKRHPIA